jgi:hypothetical protein
MAKFGPLLRLARNVCADLLTESAETANPELTLGLTS